MIEKIVSGDRLNHYKRFIFFCLLVQRLGRILRKKKTDLKVHSDPLIEHYENMPIQIYWKFYHQKMKDKKF